MAKRRGSHVQMCPRLPLRTGEQYEVLWEVGKDGNSAKDWKVHFKWIMDSGAH